MQKITTCLWFKSEAGEAAKFYVSLFKNSKVLTSNAIMATFELDGQPFYALNGNQDFKFNDSVSLFITCEDQAEIDHFWNKLTADGGQESMCGWCKDKYGVSWQVVPKNFGDLVFGPDKAGAERAMQAMMKMRKLDIATLKKAYEGK